MKIKTLVMVIAILGIAIVAGTWYLNKPVATPSDNLFGWKYPVAKFPLTGESDRLAYSNIRDPGGIPQGLPVRLKIPTIGVDSAIEDALITTDGRMDVPAGTKNVAWFALGPHPGRKGSAVIGGHFGRYEANKGPTVFYRLDELKAGDKIYIVDDKGDTLAFQVRSIKLFDRNADATTVFTSNDGLAHLNLITCEGAWNRVNDTYPKRRVVFTDAIPAKDGAVETPAIATPPRSLAMGASGADVAALQTTLQAKGFLTIPPGAAKGFFGPLTRAAVAKYQTSIGLPSSGVFDQPTRTKLFSEPSLAAVKPPTFPATAAAPETTPRPQNIIQSAKSLYATPRDGVITSLLIIAIGLMAFKISFLSTGKHD